MEAVPWLRAFETAVSKYDFAVSLTKVQIERFPALDEKVLEDKQKFEEYDRSYRSSWTEPSATGTPATNTRFTSFQAWLHIFEWERLPRGALTTVNPASGGASPTGMKSATSILIHLTPKLCRCGACRRSESFVSLQIPAHLPSVPLKRSDVRIEFSNLGSKGTCYDDTTRRQKGSPTHTGLPRCGWLFQLP
jgi:hypothetical protein